MKFYRYTGDFTPCKPDNFLFEIDNFKPEFGARFNYNNKTWHVCVLSADYAYAMVTELKLQLHAKECLYENLITCPICGYEHADS